MTQADTWFKEWFNSPYYHILYSNRDESEAGIFIEHLIEFLNPAKDAEILDLACGRGRHAELLAEQGFQVTGIDLSEESIKFAESKNNYPNLSYKVHDMREVLHGYSCSYIFNFFTSFGYFEKPSENLHTLEALNKILKPKGYLVIDFLNIKKALLNLMHEDVITRKGIEFHIQKSFDKNKLIKEISFIDNGQSYKFAERVQGLMRFDFEEMLDKAGFNIIDIAGNYKLEEFDEENSDRLIVIAQKKG